MSNELLDALKKPFPVSAISWRAGATNSKKNGGKPNKCIALAYIDARDVMNRLDEVFGINWHCKYSHADKKTICEISVLIDDKLITRANGAGDSDIEAEKGAISDAFKRAAVMFGIGRYLYDLPNVWVECDEWGHIKSPPQLPVWAIPKDTVQSPKDSAKSIAKDVWDSLQPEEQNFLSDIAIEMVAAVTDNDLKEACRLFYDNKLDSEQQTALWSRLDSKQRSTIKQYRETLKKAA